MSDPSPAVERLRATLKQLAEDPFTAYDLAVLRARADELRALGERALADQIEHALAEIPDTLVTDARVASDLEQLQGPDLRSFPEMASGLVPLVRRAQAASALKAVLALLDDPDPPVERVKEHLQDLERSELVSLLEGPPSGPERARDVSALRGALHRDVGAIEAGLASDLRSLVVGDDEPAQSP
jgi:hypothetical protein